MGAFGSKQKKFKVDPGQEYKDSGEPVESENNNVSADDSTISHKESEISNAAENNSSNSHKAARGQRKSNSRSPRKSRTPRPNSQTGSRRSSTGCSVGRASLTGIELEDTASYCSTKSFGSESRLKLLFRAYQSSPACIPIVENHPFELHGREHIYERSKSVSTINEKDGIHKDAWVDGTTFRNDSYSTGIKKQSSARAQLANQRYNKMLELMRRYESEGEKDLRMLRKQNMKHDAQMRPHTAVARSK